MYSHTYFIKIIVDIIRNDNFVFPEKNDREENYQIIARTLGYKDIESCARSINRRSIPNALNPLTFFDECIFEIYGVTNMDFFAAQLFDSLWSKNSFPEKWLEKVKFVSGKEDEFNLDEFRQFVICLLDYDKETKKKKAYSAPTTPPNMSRTPKKHIDVHKNYYPQKLFLKEEVFFDDSKCNFECFENNNRILIAGPGGQGKTTFLNRIIDFARRKTPKETASKPFYKYVLPVVSLPYIVKDIEERINSLDEESETNFILENVSDYDRNIIENHIKNLSETESQELPILVLLDGYNEIFLSSNSIAIKVLVDEIKRISKEWINAHILITCRTDTHTDILNQYPGLLGYTVCNLSGVDEDEYSTFLEKNPNLPASIRSLAKIPMYFKTLSGSKSIPKTKYDLLSQIYTSLIDQGNKHTKESGLKYYAFYILAPYLAQKISTSSNNFFDERDIANAIYELSEPDLDVLLQTSLKLTDDSNVFTLENFKIINKDRLLRFFINAGTVVKVPGKESYKFFHDDIRDYLIAFSMLRSIYAHMLCLENEDISSLSFIQTSMNVSYDVSNLFKEKVGLLGNVEEAMKKLYYPLIENKFDIDKCSDISVLYANTAFLISDYLQVKYSEIKEVLHEILLPVSENFISILELDSIVGNNQISFFTPKNKDICCKALCNVLSKEAEYYRREERFEDAVRVIEAAEKIDNKNELVVNQKAKILLCYFQHLVNKYGTSTFSKDYELEAFFPFGVSTRNSLYYEGERLLNLNFTTNYFNLSTNLLSLQYSAPCPYMVGLNLMSLDFVDAFNCAYKTIVARPDYLRREIDYTVRQAVSLLLKGYVKLAEGITYRSNMRKKFNTDKHFESCVIDPLHIKNDKNTLAFAEDLLSLADGQYLTSMNYLRGLVAFFNNEKDKAEALFKSESHLLLNQIFLNYEYGYNFDIDSEYNKLEEWISNPENGEKGFIDECHRIYWYCDAKCLELAFNPNCKEKFEKYERNFPEVCKEIVKQLTP